MILNNGVMSFEDVFELNYEVLNELEMELRPDGTIFDNNKNQILSFNGMIIKASTRPDQIHYAGQGEIEFDILNNIRMVTVLLGLSIQRHIDEGMPFLSYFPEERTDETDDSKISNLTVKFDNINEICTDFYHNKCLKFIEMIFLLEEDKVDLRNFDSTIEDDKSSK